MVTNYTLIRVRPARDKTVYLEVKKFPEVKAVVLAYGEYYTILKVARDVEKKRIMYQL